MKNKIAVIKNMNKDSWNWFVGYCKQKGKTLAEIMETIIKNIQKKQ